MTETIGLLVIVVVGYLFWRPGEQRTDRRIARR